ncbi:hypothetical protein ACFFGH_25605 [Lysobacter korlensis]|uniref:DUF3040 domain-containing protein n=1 Tax=Lysobacter korlensis TaxID=553636 RepID=A0ABV6RW64_9GAMM
MTLAEAQAIEEREGRGELDLSDPEIAAMVGQAHQRIQRDLMWGGGPGEPGRRRTWFVVLAILVFALVTAAALLIPLMINITSR